MITKIGIVAGEIWHLLDEQGEVVLSEIISKIERPRDNILMSIGWLAREGHILLDEEGSDYTVSLRKQADYEQVNKV